MLKLSFSWKNVIIAAVVFFIVALVTTICVIFLVLKKKEEESSGSILEVQLVNNGTNYFIGQTGEITGGTGKNAYYKINNVDSNGSISSVDSIEFISHGTDYKINDILTLKNENSYEQSTVKILKIGINISFDVSDIENQLFPPLLNSNLNLNLNQDNVPEITSKQVFNTNKKLWSYKDAPYVCKSLGAELATYEQLVNAAKSGANWCNIGWFKESVVENEKGEKILAHAGFPVQKEYYNKLKDDLIDENDVNVCGPELNPVFKDKEYSLQNIGVYDNYKFSVNCYGDKRSPNVNESSNYNLNDNNNTQNNLNIVNREIKKINEINPNIELLPFNTYKNIWSSKGTVVNSEASVNNGL